MTGSPNGSSPLARGLLVCVFEWRVCVGIIPARAGFTCFVCWLFVRIIPARAGFTSGGPSGAGGPGDHPRSRGVYGRGVRCLPSTVGSSPLARGLRVGSPARGGEGGIIPARAGFTVFLPFPLRWLQDHPRSRGVYARAESDPDWGGGSSPLARGLPLPPRCCPCPLGIIPARAGFTAKR